MQFKTILQARMPPCMCENCGVETMDVLGQANKSLKKDVDATLPGAKQMWLFNPDNLSFNRLLRFSELTEQSVRTGKS